jgi:hypothetical protein
VPQLDGIAFGVMQASKPPGGVALRINLHLNAGGLQLSRHFIEIAYSQVQLRRKGRQISAQRHKGHEDGVFTEDNEGNEGVTA